MNKADEDPEARGREDDESKTPPMSFQKIALMVFISVSILIVHYADRLFALF